MRRAVAGLAVGTFLLAGCSFGGDGSDDRVERSTPAPATPSAEEVTCHTIQVAVTGTGAMKERSEAGQAITFASLVAETERTKVAAGIVAMMAFGMTDLDYGPYGPALRYLTQRNRAWNPEFSSEYSMPRRTDEVVRSAERLDRDLANGMCGFYP